MTTQTEKPADLNPVSSFESGIITLNGAFIGVCLKFSMYDRTERLTHWTPDSYRALMKSLNEYAESLGQSAFMIRATKDPSLAENLPARHPYHTLLAEIPKLSPAEIGETTKSTTVAEADFVQRGPTFEVRATYSDDRVENIFFHEYTALSMFCYLDEYMKAANVLSGPMGGSA